MNLLYLLCLLLLRTDLILWVGFCLLLLVWFWSGSGTGLGSDMAVGTDTGMDSGTGFEVGNPLLLLLFPCTDFARESW